MNTAARLMQHARPGQIVTARGIARDPGGNAAKELAFFFSRAELLAAR